MDRDAGIPEIGRNGGHMRENFKKIHELYRI